MHLEIPTDYFISSAMENKDDFKTSLSFLMNFKIRKRNWKMCKFTSCLLLRITYVTFTTFFGHCKKCFATMHVFFTKILTTQILTTWEHTWYMIFTWLWFYFRLWLFWKISKCFQNMEIMNWIYKKIRKFKNVSGNFEEVSFILPCKHLFSHSSKVLNLFRMPAKHWWLFFMHFSSLESK